MDTLLLIACLVSLLVAVAALAVALFPRRTDALARVRRFELELAELTDLVDQQSRSLKKLHGRAATREAREARHADREQQSDDPMDRRPGETAEQWKARINRSLSPITRRN